MRLIVAEAILRCGHDALVGNQPSQTWVRVTGIPVLVEPDPQGRPIAGCPNVGVNLKPCTSTLAVRRGYSSWVRIGGHQVALDSVVGYTDGTPPMAVDYTVRDPGQTLVGVSS